MMRMSLPHIVGTFFHEWGSFTVKNKKIQYIISEVTLTLSANLIIGPNFKST